MSIPGAASPLFLATAASAAAAAHQIDRSIRINDDDTAYLNRTPSSTGNRKTWTWSAWVKRGKLSAEANLFSVGASNTDAAFRFETDDTLKVRDGGGGELVTNAVFRDPSAWYHIVVALDNTQSTNTDRFKVYVNGVEQTYSTASYASQNTDGDFNTAVAHYIGRQVHNTSNLFDGYLAEMHWVDGGTQLAASDFGFYDSDNVWQPKDCQSSLTYGTNGFYLKFADNSSNAALGTDSSGNSNTWTVNNLQVAVDTGVPVSAAWTGYAGGAWSSSDTWDSLSDASTNFGNNGGSKGYSSTTETWTAVKSSWSGAFGASIRGSNGWALKFSSSVTITVNPNASSIVACASTSTAVSAGTSYTSFPATMTGQVFWFTGSNYPDISIFGSVALPSGAPIDSLIDTPTNYTADSGNNGGNYCTLNPLDRQSTNGTLSNGNLDLTQSSAAWAMYRGTIAVSSGKWYYEVNIGANQYSTFGILSTEYGMGSATNNWASQTGSGKTYALYPYDGKKYDGTQGLSYATANTSPAGSVYGVAFDLDNGTITFYKDGSTLGQAFTGISGTFAPVAWLYNQSNADSYNFGQRPFAYTPPNNYNRFFAGLCVGEVKS